jgi:hypothetical protein
MNLEQPESANRAAPEPEPGDVRETFVTNDYRSIPASELRSMLDGLGPWLSAVLSHKILRKRVQPAYVIELRRMMKAKHVPKRIQKHFDDLKARLERLTFEPNFHATVPAIGPYSSATVAMSQPDGEVHFIASQVVTQVAGKLKDEGHFGFVTWLSDGTSIVTISSATLPRPRSGVDRMVIQSNDPAVVLKKHRERLRKKRIEPVAPEDLFPRTESENQKQTEDFLNRGLIRPATATEVTRIRTQM